MINYVRQAYLAQMYSLKGHKVGLAFRQSCPSQLVDLFGRLVQELLQLLVFRRVMAVHILDQSLEVLVLNRPRGNNIIFIGDRLLKPAFKSN